MPLSVFPGSLDTFTNKTDGVDTILAAHINKCQDALAALQSNLGLTAKGSLADLSTRLGVSLANDGTLNTNVIGTSQLAAGAVTTAKIANLAITQALLAAGAVGTAQIAGNAITAALIANNTITAAQIANGAIGTAQLAFPYNVLKISIPLGTIGTATGVYEGIQVVGWAGTITGVHFVSSDSLVASDLNFITLAGINKAGGAGATALLTVVATNTTKATGGQAVTAYTWNNLAGTSATVAINDVISFTATVSGTLPNTLRNSYMVITLVLS